MKQFNQMSKMMKMMQGGGGKKDANDERNEVTYSSLSTNESLFKTIQ